MASALHMGDITSLILVGGLGTRMRPLTEHLPKALLPINGRPIVEHLIAQLASEGVRRHLLLTGYLGELIAHWSKGLGPEYGEVIPFDTGQDSTTSYRLVQARDAGHLDGASVICYGDGLADVSIERLCEINRQTGTEATVSVTPLHCQYGVIEPQGDFAAAFRQKPVLRDVLVNIGYLLVNPSAAKAWSAGEDFESETLAGLAATGQLGVHRHEGYWRSVDSPMDFDLAKSDAESGRGPWTPHM